MHYIYIAETAGGRVYVGHGGRDRAKRSEFTGRVWVRPCGTKAEAALAESEVLAGAPTIEGLARDSIRRREDVEVAGFTVLRDGHGRVVADLPRTPSVPRRPSTPTKDILSDVTTITADELSRLARIPYEAANAQLRDLYDRGLTQITHSGAREGLRYRLP